MKTKSCIYSLKRVLTTFSLVLCFIYGYAQLPAYYIDNDFNSNELFRAASPVYDFHFLENGHILVGGFYSNSQVSPVEYLTLINNTGDLNTSWGGDQGLGDVVKIVAQEDGYVYPGIYGFNKILLDGTAWSIATGNFWSDFFIGGTFNPYNVEFVWDIYQEENGDLILAGAIGTDTLQPSLMRGLARLNADGTHDPLPPLDLMPNHPFSGARRVEQGSDGSWYVSGGFTGINGHDTNHIVKLTPDFEVDTNFTSPLLYDGPLNVEANILLVDSQDRIWLSGRGMRLAENPSDTVQVIRLLSNGEVDEAFSPRKLQSNYPTHYDPRTNIAAGAIELQSHPNTYIIFGQFNSYAGVSQKCIAVVDDSGNIQDHFLQGAGASANSFNLEGDTAMPSIDRIHEYENGDLLIGGAFSDFMGQERYSLVQLKLGTLSTNEVVPRIDFQIYPNPAQDEVSLSETGILRVMDITGKPVLEVVYESTKTPVDLSSLPSGLYLVSLETQDGIGIKKLVKR